MSFINGLEKPTKVYITGKNRNDIGGGFGFTRNIQSQLEDIEWVDSLQEADVYFITSCTLIDRDELRYNKKPVLFRVDNAPKMSANRGTSHTNLLLCAEKANYIVYQSEWAKEYVGWFLRDYKRDSCVIYNGVDTAVFNGMVRDYYQNGRVNFLFINRKSEENKRLSEALHMFHMYQRKYPDSMLTLVGDYSKELLEYNFNFVSGENFQIYGKVPSDMMGDVYRQNDVLLAPYYNDACSNSLIEARMCNLDIWFGTGGMTGGAKEIMEVPRTELIQETMAQKYERILKKLVDS